MNPPTPLRPLFLLPAIFILFAVAPLLAQSKSTEATTTPADPPTDPVAIELTALRDSFANQLTLAGFDCSIEPPELLLKNVKSWGNYDPKTNTLTTPLWQQLTDEDKPVFFRLAGPAATEETAHREFEIGIHHWVFIHEMGHWVQACLQQNEDREAYSIEYGANRTAMAYWRETDPKLVEHMISHFQALLKSAPSPIPKGKSVEAYFNDNYEKLAGTPTYTWFQSEMINKIYEERPIPTFKQSLKQPII
jgi:hypothetical protein